jgi:hypothetical protein
VNRSIMIVEAIVLAFLLAQVATLTSTAKAARVDQAERAEAEDFDRAVALMEEHMRVKTDGTLALDREALTRDIKSGDGKGIHPRTLTQLEKALARTNAALRANRMEASDVFPSSERDLSIHKTSFTIMGCRGRNGYEDYWWGRRSYLDDCRTHTLVDALRAGAAVCGVLPSLQTRLCALLGSLGAVYIARVDRRGGHDGIYINWSPTLRVIYAIRSQ